MKTILVIDDNQDFREMIRYVLSQEGYRVLSAPTASRASPK